MIVEMKEAQQLPQLILIFSLLIINNHSLADYKDSEVRTQINGQTNYFKETLDDPEALFNEFKSDYGTSQQHIKSGPDALNTISECTGFDSGEVREGIDELKSIKAKRLDDLGYQEMGKQNVMGKIYVDYNRSLNKRMLQDAKELTETHGALHNNLFAKIKELGVDCKKVKVDKKVKPAFYLQNKNTKYKDTVYNQGFCEDLRNEYNCNDTLTLNCTKTGVRWDPWERRELVIGGKYLWNNHPHWVKTVKWKRGGIFRHAKHRGVINYEASDDIKSHIASLLKVSKDQVEFVGSREDGELMRWPRDRFRMHLNYVIHYKYRNGEKICINWQETWKEKCQFK